MTLHTTLVLCRVVSPCRSTPLPPHTCAPDDEEADLAAAIAASMEGHAQPSAPGGSYAAVAAGLQQQQLQRELNDFGGDPGAGSSQAAEAAGVDAAGGDMMFDEDPELAAALAASLEEHHQSQQQQQQQQPQLEGEKQQDQQPEAQQEVGGQPLGGAGACGDDLGFWGGVVLFDVKGQHSYTCSWVTSGYTLDCGTLSHLHPVLTSETPLLLVCTCLCVLSDQAGCARPRGAGRGLRWSFDCGFPAANRVEAVAQVQQGRQCSCVDRVRHPTNDSQR